MVSTIQDFSHLFNLSLCMWEKGINSFFVDVTLYLQVCIINTHWIKLLKLSKYYGHGSTPSTPWTRATQKAKLSRVQSQPQVDSQFEINETWCQKLQDKTRFVNSVRHLSRLIKLQVERSGQLLMAPKGFPLERLVGVRGNPAVACCSCLALTGLSRSNGWAWTTHCKLRPLLSHDCWEWFPILAYGALPPSA